MQPKHPRLPARTLRWQRQTYYLLVTSCLIRAAVWFIVRCMRLTRRGKAGHNEASKSYTAIITNHTALGDLLVTMTPLQHINDVVCRRNGRLLLIRAHSLGTTPLLARKHLKHAWKHGGTSAGFSALTAVLRNREATQLERLLQPHDIDVFFVDTKRIMTSTFYRLAVCLFLSNKDIERLCFPHDARGPGTCIALGTRARKTLYLHPQRVPWWHRARDLLPFGNRRADTLSFRAVAFLRGFTRSFHMVTPHHDRSLWTYTTSVNQPCEGDRVHFHERYRAVWEPMLDTPLPQSLRPLHIPYTTKRSAFSYLPDTPFGVVNLGYLTFDESNPFAPHPQVGTAQQQSTKVLCNDAWRAILRALVAHHVATGGKVVCLAAPNNATAVLEFLHHLDVPSPSHCVFAPPFFDINSLVHLIAGAQYLVSEDTGPAHIGINTQTPTYVIANRLSNQEERAFLPYPDQVVAEGNQRLFLLPPEAMICSSQQTIEEGLIPDLLSFVSPTPA
ncbi:MAG: hypothetical protein K0U36_00070 [Alphaproteobacteria bacterium]|nr:hypothetical protein [Alphaproteobacteria bacterium]